MRLAFRRRRQPPGIDYALGEIVLAGEAQCGFAQPLFVPRMRRDKISRARGMADIVVGRGNALDIVSVEQRCRRFSGKHEVEFPGDIFRVLETGISAARAERRHLVRRVAGKNYPPMGEALHAPALELIEGDPFELEITVADHSLDAGPHIFRALLGFGIGIPPELQIDAPDIIRLFVQKRGLSGMERWIEPEPPFGWEFSVHAHVGDEELILECLANELGPDQPAQAGARTIAGDHIICGKRVGAFRRLDRQPYMIVGRLQADDFVAPAQIDLRHGGNAFAQEFLGVILLQIDEGRHFVPAFGQEIEAVYELVAQEHFTDLPDDPLFKHALADAKSIPIFERAFGKTDRARALADAIGIIEQNDVAAALREIDCGGKAHRPGADDDQRMARGYGPILIGAAAIAKLEQAGTRLRRHFPPRVLAPLERCGIVAFSNYSDIIERAKTSQAKPWPSAGKSKPQSPLGCTGFSLTSWRCWLTTQVPVLPKFTRANSASAFPNGACSRRSGSVT